MPFVFFVRSNKQYHDEDRKTDDKYANPGAHGTDGSNAQLHGRRVTCLHQQHLLRPFRIDPMSRTRVYRTFMRFKSSVLWSRVVVPGRAVQSDQINEILLLPALISAVVSANERIMRCTRAKSDHPYTEDGLVNIDFHLSRGHLVGCQHRS